MRETEEIREKIIEMVRGIEDKKYLEKIYYFIKVFIKEE